MAKPAKEEKPVETAPAPSAEGFWNRLAALDEADWEHHRLYVYRLAPAIDTGDRHYVARLQRAIDEQYLLEHFGSGRYLLVLNNARERKQADKIVVSLHNLDYPPRVRLDQLTADPANEA